MKLMGHIAGRKFLQRILFYFNLSMAGLLLITALSFYLFSRETILQTQQEANQKVLTQIKHNINYIHDIVRNLGIVATLDPSIIYLMNAAQPDPVMKFQTLRKLDTLADSTSFVDSIVVYSGTADQFYSGGSGVWSRQHWPELQSRLMERLGPSDAGSLAQLIPLKLDENGSYVDLFSYIVVDHYPGQDATPNAVVVNIRPEWIFENIMQLDNMTDTQSGMVLVDERGRLLQSDDMDVLQPAAVQAYLSESPATTGAEGTADFSIRRIGGDRYVISELSVGVSQWKVLNILPYEQVMGRAETLRNAMLLLIGAFLVASFVLSLVISNRLYRPVGKLFELFKRTGLPGSDAGAAPAAASEDEMRFITDVYQSTLEKLREVDQEGNRSRKIVGDYYLRRWVADSATMTEEELQHCAEASPQLFATGETADLHWAAAVVALDQPQAPGGVMSPAEARQEKLYRFAACNIIEETVARRYANRVVDMNGEYLVVILQVETGEVDMSGLAGLLGEAQQTYKRYYLGRTFAAALGQATVTYSELTATYEAAVQQLMYRLALGPDAIITPATIQSNLARQDFSIPAELEHKLAESLRAKNADAVQAVLGRMFGLIATIHYDYMTYAVMQVILVIKQILREPAFAVHAGSVELQHLNRKVLQAESLTDMQELIGGYLAQICQADHSPLKEDRNKLVVDTMKEFIETHYADINLSLQSIAEHLKMSPAYVGRLFKQYEQCSVGDYLNSYRLEKACELLVGSSYNVKEVADYLGFNNASYFITLFKKKYGMTPKEYRLNAALGQ
ncbi:AraC family transcriptional regulator [Paenibacillus daejeonensis]|uniref:AraC family transcriptional regulator n=1 Tax=Paenibacillus daejeonensis TaxID=135193 RepID=UPI000367B43E|nr:helix-turn-helix domain-containing protein [Paenibacillus daejeonensis]